MKKILLFIIAIVTFNSCSKDGNLEDYNYSFPQTEASNGNWFAMSEQGDTVKVGTTTVLKYYTDGTNCVTVKVRAESSELVIEGDHYSLLPSLNGWDRLVTIKFNENDAPYVFMGYRKYDMLYGYQYKEIARHYIDGGW